MKGNFGYADSFGGRIVGGRLLCELTLKDGHLAWDWNGRAAIDYKEIADRNY